MRTRISAENRYTSKIEGVCWLAMLSRRGAAVMAMMRQLDESQWWDEDELRAEQNRQIALLVEHAYKSVPYYRKLWDSIGKIPDPASDEWLRVPVLTRKALQASGQDLVASDMPATHGKTRVVNTSGSLGMPVKLHATDVTGFMWEVFTMRDHLWHERTFKEKLAVLRFLPDDKVIYPNVLNLSGWGSIAGEIFNTGPAKLLNIRSNINDIIRW